MIITREEDRGQRSEEQLDGHADGQAGGRAGGGPATTFVDAAWSALVGDFALEATQRTVAAGETVYEPKSPARDLYFIRSGQIRTYAAGPDQTARMLEILGPGEWFGEAALAAADSHCCRAVATSSTSLEVVPVDRLMELLLSRPTSAAELIRQLAARLLAAREDGNQFVFDDCNARLIKALLRFSRTAAATSQEGGRVLLRITHRQLAQAVGAARETVSLGLTHLRQQNLLETGRNQLLFRPAELEGYVREQAGIVRQ